MGMTTVEVYPVPRIRKTDNGRWRVTWASSDNQVWYNEFYSWQECLRWTLNWTT